MRALERAGLGCVCEQVKSSLSGWFLLISTLKNSQPANLSLANREPHPSGSPHPWGQRGDEEGQKNLKTKEKRVLPSDQMLKRAFAALQRQAGGRGWEGQAESPGGAPPGVQVLKTTSVHPSPGDGPADTTSRSRHEKGLCSTRRAHLYPAF